MTAIKASDVDRFIAKPNPSQPIVLVFGPDAGLVRERVDALVRASVEDPNDPFAFVRIEGEELSANPARLVEEAHTVPLFGGRRAVLVKAGSRNIAGAVETVVAAPSEECRVIIEAGDLKKSSPLRMLCEKAKVAAALPCYADNEATLARLIDDEMREAGLTIAPDARAALLGLLGGDRLASRAEIRKLALYAQGRPAIEMADVLAVVADASALGARWRDRFSLCRQDRRGGKRIRQGARRRCFAGRDYFGGDPSSGKPAQDEARSRRRRFYRQCDAARRAAGAFFPPRCGRRGAARLVAGAASARHAAIGRSLARGSPQRAAGRGHCPAHAVVDRGECKATGSLTTVVPAKAGTHTRCALDSL